MSLATILTADPVEALAKDLAEDCARLAQKSVSVYTRDDAVEKMRDLQPTLAVIGCELGGDRPIPFFKELRDASPNTQIVASFRELSVSLMDQITDVGVKGFVPTPVPRSDIYQFITETFRIQTRVHPRYPIRLEIKRPDGVLLGHSKNLSPTGLSFETSQLSGVNQSLMLVIDFQDEHPPIRLRTRLLHIEGKPPRCTARGFFENVRGLEQRRIKQFLEKLENAGTRPE